MLIKQIIDVYNLVDSSDITGEKVAEYLKSIRDTEIEVHTISGEEGSTDFIRIKIKGKNGKSEGGNAPTLGVLGRLGGIGARPERLGIVSDGDGALVALSVAAKLLDMQNKGDFLNGDIIVSTHICPDAPTQPHEPVPFMGSPVDMQVVNEEEVRGDFDAVLSIDTTKGNRIINYNGFAISPTVKEGYILKVSDDLLDLMEITTGQLPKVFALSEQDITPYGNDLYHLNSILQPATATEAPVVGVAITTETVVPGCATGASHPSVLETCGRFVVEVAKAYGKGKINFYDKIEYEKILQKYGSMKKFQTLGD
ncbi:DUF1177 domain-containing protein [Anaerococcus sp. AGMB00486]|uniref:DUF1177 domain-containing protein n=2 Tax=Anaerococcus TaxID=165779 RepID=A0ABX2N6Z6_9FIRM|nr:MULTISPECIES: DUF1177 domain-containing protein [Anaerococcus]MSS77050.1 DUF1177 domain-containing protein [Anaerococcus porci]NVF10461.1 DUF1177 domain-containing protein [Anaerococcus faecalis]